LYKIGILPGLNRSKEPLISSLCIIPFNAPDVIPFNAPDVIPFNAPDVIPFNAPDVIPAKAGIQGVIPAKAGIHLALDLKQWIPGLRYASPGMTNCSELT